LDKILDKQKNTFGMFTSTMPFRIQVDEALDAYSWMKQVGTAFFLICSGQVSR
jgi:hypothetical protein